MRLDLTADQELLLGATRQYLEARPPIARIRQAASSSAAAAFDSADWQQGSALGWTSMLVAESDGGGTVSGDGLADLLVLAEELGGALHPGPIVTANVAARAVSELGTPGQRAALLPATLSGQGVLAWAVHEHGSTWTPDGISLRACPTADGWELSGEKTMVVDATAATSILVAARLDGGGYAQFIAPVEAGGISISAAGSLDLNRELATIRFAAVRLPAAALLGDPAQAREAIERQLSLAALLTAAQLVGAAERAFQMTVEYGLVRVSFGRPILSYQALKHRLADARARLEAAHGLLKMAGDAVAEGSPQAPLLVSAAKSYLGDLGLDVVQEAVQLHGGIGVTWEHDLHLYLRRVTVDRYLYGDPAEHLARIASRIGLDQAARPAQELAWQGRS